MDDTGKTENVTLKRYNAILHHAGNMLHQIPIKMVTERELRLLRAIHGQENIENVEYLDEVQVDSRTNYFQLLDKYGGRDDMARMEMMKRRIERLFSIQIDNFEDWLTERMEATQVKQEGRVREQAHDEQARIDAEVERRVAARMAAQQQQAQEAESSIGE